MFQNALDQSLRSPVMEPKEPRKIETKWFPDFVAKLPSLDGKVVCITGCTTGAESCCNVPKSASSTEPGHPNQA